MIKEYKDWLFVKVKPDWVDFMVLSRPGTPEINKGLPDHYDLYANGIYNTPIVGLFLKNKPQIIGKGDALGDLQASIITQEKHLPNGHLAKLLRSLGMEPGTTLVLKKNEK